MIENKLRLKLIVDEKTLVAFDKHRAKVSLPPCLNQFELEIGLRNGMYELAANVLSFQLPPKRTEIAKEVIYDIPSSWCQHFKFDFSYKWWMRKFVELYPVKFHRKKEEITFVWELESTVLWPELDCRIPQEDSLGRPVLWAKLRFASKTGRLSPWSGWLNIPSRSLSPSEFISERSSIR